MTASRLFFSYFPQFHADPLNDKAWGKGFTDWDLIRALPEAKRRSFTPVLGFYDPSRPEYIPQLERQLEDLPLHAGLMVYHYHFDGVFALTGFERQLLAQRSSLPLFLCWANESWSKRWVGEPRNIIVEQQHRPDEQLIRRHARYLAQFFDLPRYERIGGRPLLLIYSPQAGGGLPRSITLYRDVFADLGHKPLIGACVGYPQPQYQLAKFDFACEFQPRFFFNGSSATSLARAAAVVKERFPRFFEWISTHRELARKRDGELVYSYASYLGALASGQLERQLRATIGTVPLMRSVFLTWDNAPRYGARGSIVDHAGVPPEALAQLRDVRSDDALPLLVNSWNEWSEGAALEPAASPHPLREAFVRALAGA